MQTLAARIARRGTEVQRKCAGAILQSVVMSTPVGNRTLWDDPKKARVGYVGGRARANWLVSIGIPKKRATETTDAGGSNTISAGQTIIRNSFPQRPIYLSNNVPYIMLLNNGHSKQAPAGFIQTSIQVGIGVIKSEKLTEEGKST
jgi:hypothetical protein